MVRIYRSILSQNKRNVPGRTMKPTYITIHNTANSSRGANAAMHSRYQHNGSGGRMASWHYTVDDKEIWQTLEDWQQGYHAGDVRGKGNTQSIGIEVCENSDGDFKKTVKNAQWLISVLMKKHNIPLSRVVPHRHWSGKNCPRLLLSRWDEFKSGIGTSNATTIKRPNNVNRPVPNTNSIVDYLNSIGQDSSFSNREKLAKQYGIDDYRGTSYQNTELLRRVKEHYLASKENTNKKEIKEMIKNVTEVSSWAKDAWEEAVQEGYFDGSNPGNPLTREQGAIVIERLADNIKKFYVEPLEKEVEELKQKIEELENNS